MLHVLLSNITNPPHTQYFTGLGYKLPFGENPADWMLDISSGSLKKEAKKKGKVGFSLGESTKEEEDDEDLGANANTRIDYLEKTWRKSQADAIPEEKEDKYGGLDSKGPRGGFFTQYFLYLERLFLQRSRRFKMIILDALLVVGSAYLAAQIAGPYVPIDDVEEVIDIPAEVIINMTIPGAERMEYPTPQFLSLASSNEYAMIANLLFVGE